MLRISNIAAMFGTILFYIFLPLLTILLVVQYIKLKIIEFYVKCSSKGTEMVNAVSDQNYSVGKIFIQFSVKLGGKLNVETFMVCFTRKILERRDERGREVYGFLRRKLNHSCGYPFWKMDEEFNLKNHIRFYEGPPNGISMDEYRELKSQIDKGQLDPLERSPWELWLVHVWDHEEGRTWTSFVFRIHHMLGDGHTLYHLLCNVCDTPISLIRPKTASQAASHPSRWTGLVGTLKVPYAAIQTGIMLANYTPPWPISPPTIRNAAVSKRMLFANIRETARTENVSVSTVLTTLMIKALDKSCPRMFKTGTNGVLMTALQIPIQNRKESSTGNPILPTALLPIPTAQPDDVEGNFKVFEKVLARCRNSGLLSPAFLWFGTCCADLLRVDSKLPSKFLTHSNFPGPATQMFIQGNPVEDLDVSLEIFGDYPSSVTTLTYNGYIRFRLSADNSIMTPTEADEFIANIEAGVEEYCNGSLSIAIS